MGNQLISIEQAVHELYMKMARKLYEQNIMENSGLFIAYQLDWEREEWDEVA